MKNILLLITLSLFTVQLTTAQEKSFNKKKLPNIILKSLDGEDIKLSEIQNEGKPIIINFWATWCSPCKRELNAISEQYEDWVEETGVKLYAVSIDDQRTTSRVKPYVDASGWEYEILLDPNSELKRAMGVNNVPHTFLVDGDGYIIWQHNNYNPGDEYELYDKIIEISGEE